MHSEWRPYIEGLRRRADADARALVSRKQKALHCAQLAADLLRRDYGAQRVVVFGSVTRDDFSSVSDVDIAAWGLGKKDTFKAMSAVSRLSKDIEINLVDMNVVRDYIEIEIVRTGIDL